MADTITVANIIINRPSKHLNKTFSYEIPDELSYIGPGWRCVVPFANKMEEGIIISLAKVNKDELSYDILPIQSTVDDFPWFSSEMLETAKWISQYYLCTYVEALRLFLIDKRGLKNLSFYEIQWHLVAETDLFRELIDSSVILISAEDAMLILGKELLDFYVKNHVLIRQDSWDLAHRTPLTKWIEFNSEWDLKLFRKGSKQYQLAEYLQGKKKISIEKLKEEGFVTSVINKFIEKTNASIFYKPKATFSLVENPTEKVKRCLTAEQKNAVNSICEAVNRNSYSGILLHGVTGSGKTEVYLRIARHVLSQGGSVLIEVPEIALTAQMVDYFAKEFGDQVVFIHSNLNKNERYNNRRRIELGESRIIIGSRSALFMPFRNLRLIVVDEEYDSSYKQWDSPRYNGRDVAKVMAVIYQCPIVLGAATPAIDTYFAAKNNKIKLIEMNERVHHTPLPKVYICDMKDEYNSGNGTHISRPLVNLLKETKEKGKKSILLLNRRGYATILLCKKCGYAFKCPHCDVALVYHKDQNRLQCHYCENSFLVPHNCPKCNEKEISYLGRGTQRIEEELAQLIPEAAAVRFDVDSTANKYSASEILNDFRDGIYDILFGTQMVAKGHDIPGVQSVGILSADSILNIPSYLAAEQTFNLITQCAGRAGRNKEQGTVVLQTYNPHHYAIQCAAKQDYRAFYEQELQFRRLLNYPPFTRMMKISTFNHVEKNAKIQLDQIYQWVINYMTSHQLTLSVTRPFEENIKKVRNQYYFSISIKGTSLSKLKEGIREAPIFQENNIIIDVDPI